MKIDRKKWRKLLGKKILMLPGAFNALCGLALKDVGYQALYVSGASLHNRVGLADVGLLSLDQMSSGAVPIIQTSALPVICDIDTGLGDVRKTIRRYEDIGAWGVHIEDQRLPKKCGHLAGKEIISTKEMVAKIKTAVNARKDKNFLIIARTDARAVNGMSDTVERGLAYREAGADIIFPEALTTKKEFQQFADLLGGLLLANMTEFGKSPYIEAQELEKMGYSIVLYPLTAMRLMLKTVKDGMDLVRDRGTQQSLLRKMMTRQELYRLLNYKP